MLDKRIIRELQVRRNSGLYRDPPLIEGLEGKYVFVNGQKLINFASNDYLGLAASNDVQKKIADNYLKYRASASSSRLVCGNTGEVNRAEGLCAAYFGYEDALIFPSGFQANVGLLSALFDETDSVFYDKHIHASLVAGLRLSNAEKYGFNHNDPAHLEKRLSSVSKNSNALVTESLFSMDGDLLDAEALNTVRQHYGLYTIVDEAHSFGVLGNRGTGLARTISDIAIGTFGKAFALSGAVVLLPAVIKEYLVNFSSAQIYSTAVSPAHAVSIMDMLDVVEHCDDRRLILGQACLEMKRLLQARGLTVSGDAHILSVFIGNEAKAAGLAADLQKEGFFVLASRYPTVNYGKAILRISMNALITPGDINKLVSAFDNLFF